MQTGDEHIDYDLLARYLAGETGPAENAAIQIWLAESPDHRELLEELRQVLHTADSAKPETPVDTDAAWARVQQQMKPPGGKVVQMSRKKNYRTWRVAALAAMFVGVIFFAGVLIYSIPAGGPVEMAVVATENNTRTDTLPDGTIVTLNKNSTINYPESFENGRYVMLTGEAFFDVAHNPDKPFIIEADALEITVLGTSFNVSSYQDDETTEVVVATGKVAVKDAAGRVVDLLPGEKAVYEKDIKTMHKTVNDDIDYQFWRLKKLVFANTSLSEVVDVLNRQYQAKLSLENDAAAACRFTATFEDDSLQTILDVLTATFALELEETADGRILKGNACDANSL